MSELIYPVGARSVPRIRTGRMATPRYGCDHLGRLTRAMLHRPRVEADADVDCPILDPWNLPEVLEEHDRYAGLLQSLGVDVLYLADYARTSEPDQALPELLHLNDAAVVTRHGAFLSSCMPHGDGTSRQAVSSALARAGVDIRLDMPPTGDDCVGCQVLSPYSLLVTDTRRKPSPALTEWMEQALRWYPEIIYVRVPRMRRFKRPDSILGRATADVVVAYPPAFEEILLITCDGQRPIDLIAFMAMRDIEVVPVSGAEQQRLACGFVALDSGTLLQYDDALGLSTRRVLERLGIDVITFHAPALSWGGRSLQSLTLALNRHAANGGS